MVPKRENEKKAFFFIADRSRVYSDYIGSYHDEVRAAQAYDIKAKEVFGEFANINFPSQKTKLINEKNRNENVDLD